MRILILLLIWVQLSACSTADFYNSSCDFVTSAAESQQVREERLSRPGTVELESNRKVSDDTVQGILGVVFGSISRLLSSDEANNNPCL